jgi:hypothetical protein
MLILAPTGTPGKNHVIVCGNLGYQSMYVDKCTYDVIAMKTIYVIFVWKFGISINVW